MRIQDWRIQLKIVVPFTLLLTAAGLLVAALSTSVLTHTIENEVRERVNRAASMISQSHFVDNVTVLQLLKKVIGADIVTYTETGETLASTLPPEEEPLLMQVRSSEEARGVFAAPNSELAKTLTSGDKTFRVAYRPLSNRSKTAVALVVDMTETIQTRVTIARTLFALSLLIALVTFGLSHLLARHITSPITELAATSRLVAEGDLSRRASIQGEDEVGALARAFNDMIEKLQQSKDKLMQSERLVATGLLAAQVAHDVRNPLSAIKMQTQLLRTRLRPGEENQEILQSVLRDVDRVEWVVKGLLELARPGELKLSETHINGVVSEVLRLIDPQMRHRKVHVETRLDASIPAFAVDQDRLKQVLLNVCLNASEAMPTGGVMKISTDFAPELGSVFIDVDDEGTGVDPAIRDRLFSPFASSKKDGIGLGLFSARNILERHGGSIELLNAPGGGTRARLTLPARQATPSGNGQKQH
jgi:signal transduction histidine kinase